MNSTWTLEKKQKNLYLAFAELAIFFLFCFETDLGWRIIGGILHGGRCTWHMELAKVIAVGIIWMNEWCPLGLE